MSTDPFPGPQLAVLNEKLWFPPPETAAAAGELAGLVALGGDLSVGRLLLAYQRGIFPWTTNPVTWWSPDPRAIFEFGQFHISRSFRQVLQREASPARAHFVLTFDRAFPAVIKGCAARGKGERKKTWISREFIEAYVALHRAGHAHSIECWQAEQLVGGVYGVAIGGLFAAESMFHRASDASKVALFALISSLDRAGFSLFDIQMLTPHTRSLGATNIPRKEYLERLRQALANDRRFPTTPVLAGFPCTAP